MNHILIVSIAQYGQQDLLLSDYTNCQPDLYLSRQTDDAVSLKASDSWIYISWDTVAPQ